MNMAAKRRPLLLAVGVVLCLLLAGDLAYRYATRGDARAVTDTAWTVSYRVQAVLESPLADPPMAHLQSATWTTPSSRQLPVWQVHSYTTGTEYATTVNVVDGAGVVVGAFHPTVEAVDVLDGQWHHVMVRAAWYGGGLVTVTLTVDGHAGADTIGGELAAVADREFGGGFQGDPERNVVDVKYAG